MKSSTKILLPLLALAAAGAISFVRAADEVQTPLPNAPDSAPPAPGEKGDRPMRGGGPRMRLKAMKEKLNLTADQEKQIGDIWKSHADDMKAARGDHAKMEEVMKAQHEEVRAVLTPDQQKIFDAMPPPGERHGGKKKDGPPPPPPAAAPASAPTT
jgi:Spy/CpxP family protein refolding chaperone